MHRTLGLCLFSAIACLTISEAQAQPVGPSAPQITAGIDEANLVTLSGNTRPEATAANDRGAVSDKLPLDHIQLLLHRPALQEQALEQTIDALHNPASSSFHKWLTASQFGQQFGVASKDVSTITSWLSSHGFKVNLVSTSRMVIDFSGTAGQVRDAFHAEIHNLNVNGQTHIANMSDPKIPAALAPAITGIVSLHDFVPSPMLLPRPNYTYSGSGCAGTCYYLVPADLATIYDFDRAFNAASPVTGNGQTITVVEDSDVYSSNDWYAFRQTLGPSIYSSGSLAVMHPPSGNSNNCSDPGTNGDDGEAIADAEWASAAAPGAAIVVASCENTTATSGVLIALENLANSIVVPQIISISYASCEVSNGATSNAAIYSVYQLLVIEGASIFVSAGDSGAATCDSNPSLDERLDNFATHGIGVNAFASTPYNVAVGGTDFGDTYANTNSTYWNSSNTSSYGSAKGIPGSALSYIPEIPGTIPAPAF